MSKSERKKQDHVWRQGCNSSSVPWSEMKQTTSSSINIELCQASMMPNDHNQRFRNT